MKQGREKTPRHVIVCQGSNCRRNGSPELMERLQQALSQDEALQIHTLSMFWGLCRGAKRRGCSRLSVVFVLGPPGLPTGLPEAFAPEHA